MHLGKRQTITILALAALNCLLLVIGIAVVARRASSPSTLAPAVAMSAQTRTPPAPTRTSTLTPTGWPLPVPLPPPTTTPVFTETEMLVLQRVADALCCASWQPCNQNYFVKDTLYGFGCFVAAGHHTGVQIQRFPSEAQAGAALDALRKDNPIQSFHGYQAVVWQYDQNPDNPGFPMRHRHHAWQAGCWLIDSSSFDDTHYVIAPDPQSVSEIVYREAKTRCLFPGAC